MELSSKEAVIVTQQAFGDFRIHILNGESVT